MDDFDQLDRNDLVQKKDKHVIVLIVLSQGIVEQAILGNS
jgi:hypothetical protein